MLDKDDELAQVFRAEANEALDDLSTIVDELSRADAATAQGLLRRAFRVTHNIKGAARLSGFHDIETVAHTMEDALSGAQGDASPAAAEFVRLLGGGIHLLARGVAGVPITEEARAFGRDLSSSSSGRPATLDASPSRPLDASGTGADLTGERDRPGATEISDAHSTVRVDTARLDRLMRFTEEILSFHAKRLVSSRELGRITEELDRSVSEHREQPWPELQKLLDELSSWAREEAKETRLFGHLSLDFGAAIKMVRMQPLGTIMAHWRRLVAEVAHDSGKQVTFESDVGDTAMDRQILDSLRDPLMHILRNAVAHGIESAGQRASSGKPLVGRVRFRARAKGTMVELEVADDGRGPDVAAVIRKAHERKILPEETRTISLDEAVDLLFMPGMSTAAAVDRVSGRGVGLDVVRARVGELGGRIHASPTGPLGGMAFRLLVPATLVSSRGLLVRSGAVVAALPVVHVVRTMRVDRESVRQADGSPTLMREEGTPLKLRWLRTVLGEERRGDPPKLPIVVVSAGAGELGLVVDEVLHEAELVVKRLPWNLINVPLVSGAVVLGDGGIAAVLDVDGLSLTRAKESMHEEPPRAQIVASKRRVLVADDSLTTRTLERNILLSAGYDVEVATDGESALRLLQERPFDLLVSDVEMPNITGIELTRRIRADARLRDLPVILVTSMDRPEDVAAGAAAGADEYIVKGRFDQARLLEAVARLL